MATVCWGGFIPLILSAENMMLLRKKVLAWLVELRAPFLSASVIPVVLGSTIAWARLGTLDLVGFVLALAAGVLMHLGTNVVNDYFDHKSGNDEVNQEFVRPFSGGSRTIQRGFLTPSEVFFGALLFFAVGSLIGMYLAWTRGPLILVLGVIGFISGFFYTGPPLNHAGHGVGELLVGVNFGLLMTVGAFYVQTRTVSWEAALASVPISCLIAAVLYINEFPDYNADRAVGKRTLVVRFGRERAVRGYEVLLGATYLSLAAAVALEQLPPYSLLGLLTIPLGVRGILYLRRCHSDIPGLVPANALTALNHLLTGALIIFGYVLYGLRLLWAP